MARQTLPSGTPVEVAAPHHAPLGLVIAPDIFGLRPLFDDMVAQIAAEQGWAVAAVEPFPHLPADADIDARFAAVPGLMDDRVVGDLAAAGALLGTASTALIGFCMGGMYANKAAAHGSFRRICSFYGMIRLPTLWRGDGQAEPLPLVTGAPTSVGLLAIVGGRDPYTPADDIDALEAAACATVTRYPEADHGFVHDATRPAHRPADAADAWARMLAHVGA